MQVLDTHVWLWWMSNDERLNPFGVRRSQPVPAWV